jgi:2-polyprenyl-3-methyl-5-hydroxy-6-metoxy-1,4-benzoquinol methylase
VILVSPTSYHEKLAQNAGFFSAGTGIKAAGRLGRLFSGKKTKQDFLQNLSRRCEKIAAAYGLDKEAVQTLAGLLDTFNPIVCTRCPACGNSFNGKNLFPVIARFPERTYLRCPRCNMVYMDRLTEPPIEYAKDYFFDFYKKQYGKTYIEDFPNLVAMGKKRLAVIKSMVPGTRLLDIGCAYGPFLAAARDEGFLPVGIDPAQEAVAYVRSVLNIEAYAGFFPDTPLPEVLAADSFDAVTLWFVIEHFRDFKPVLKEIRRILKPGGVLAFSTPSFSGISRRRSRNAFLEKSPADHFSIWSPHCRKILKQAGFRLRRVRVTGHHPERFPGIGKFAVSQKGLIYRFIMLISGIFGLGDTFEAYALKE